MKVLSDKTVAISTEYHGSFDGKSTTPEPYYSNPSPLPLALGVFVSGVAAAASLRSSLSAAATTVAAVAAAVSRACAANQIGCVGLNKWSFLKKAVKNSALAIKI